MEAGRSVASLSIGHSHKARLLGTAQVHHLVLILLYTVLQARPLRLQLVPEVAEDEAGLILNIPRDPASICIDPDALGCLLLA